MLLPEHYIQDHSDHELHRQLIHASLYVVVQMTVCTETTTFVGENYVVRNSSNVVLLRKHGITPEPTLSKLDKSTHACIGGEHLGADGPLILLCCVMLAAVGQPQLQLESEPVVQPVRDGSGGEARKDVFHAEQHPMSGCEGEVKAASRRDSHQTPR